MVAAALRRQPRGGGQPHHKTPVSPLGRRALAREADPRQRPKGRRSPMPPLGTSKHLAARMGRWSASHWKTATFGWLAFVVAAFAIGSVLGTKTLDPNKTGSGESGHVQSVLADEFKQPANESVIVKSSTSTVDAPEFRRAVASVISTLQSQQHVRAISSPFVPANAGQISADRHAALVQFKMEGTDLSVSDKQVVAVESAVADVQKSYPSFFIGQS